MAVQFNLLPDVKIEFMRQQKTKHFAYTVSILSVSAVLILVVFSFVIVNVVQRQLLNSTSDDIKKYSEQLKSIPDLDKILTVQNQLDSLPKLHDAKHIPSRFLGYLPQVIPTKVHVGQTSLDLTTNTMLITGTADTLETVNQFVDTLKFTSMVEGTGGDQKDAGLAFTNVVLTSASRSEKNASYSISTNFDPALFDSTRSVSLKVPNKITTRSVTDAPDISNLLFNGDTGKTNKQQGN
jgi:Tfp pilus assembly protein PilN